MKTIPLSLLLAAQLLTAIAPAIAAEPAPAGTPEMAAVGQFLRLSDVELDQLQQVIARIRAMKPEERAALLQEITKFRQLPEPAREQLRRGWGRVPGDIQEAWREMMQRATPEQRAAIQAELRSRTPEEKAAYRRQLAEDYLKTKPAKP